MSEGKKSIVQLHQPHHEDEADIIGRFLLDEEEIEEKKKTLDHLWRMRRRKVEMNR
jgi:hypothetical protein